MSRKGGSASGSPGTLGVIDISDIVHYFDQDKSISISQLIDGKSRGLQKILKYFNWITASTSNIFLLFGVLPINFILYSKDLLVIVLLLFIHYYYY